MSPSLSQEGVVGGHVVHIQMLSLKMLQKHAVLKPPQQNSSKDDAVPVGTEKNVFNTHSCNLVSLPSLWEHKPMPKEMQLFGVEKSFACWGQSYLLKSPCYLKYCSSKYFDFDQTKKISQDHFFSISQCLCLHPIFWSILQIMDVLYRLLRQISSTFGESINQGRLFFFTGIIIEHGELNLSESRNYEAVTSLFADRSYSLCQNFCNLLRLRKSFESAPSYGKLQRKM